MNSEAELVTTIILSFIGISILSIVIFILYHTKIKKVKMNIVPSLAKKMKLIDILILNYPNSQNLQIYPVLQDETKKIYLQFLHYSYGNYKSKIKKEIPLQIKMITNNNNEVSQNETGLVRINKEIGNIKVNENKVIIDNCFYNYGGNILNQNNFETQKTTIFNLYKNNFLEIINNAILYEGIVEFDKEKVLENNSDKKEARL